jgi:hypothetical protein
MMPYFTFSCSVFDFACLCIILQLLFFAFMAFFEAQPSFRPRLASSPSLSTKQRLALLRRKRRTLSAYRRKKRSYIFQSIIRCGLFALIFLFHDVPEVQSSLPLRISASIAIFFLPTPFVSFVFDVFGGWWLRLIFNLFASE